VRLLAIISNSAFILCAVFYAITYGAGSGLDDSVLFLLLMLPPSTALYELVRTQKATLGQQASSAAKAATSFKKKARLFLSSNKKKILLSAAALLLALYLKPAFFGFYGFNIEQCHALYTAKAKTNTAARAAAMVCRSRHDG